MATTTVHETACGDLSTVAVCARIRAALRERSGLDWSVTRGRGTVSGWITIEAPPKRRTSHSVHREGAIGNACDTYEEVDTGKPNGNTTQSDRARLGALLNLESIHTQGVSIMASHDAYREYIDRAEGRTPAKIAEPYWD